MSVPVVERAVLQAAIECGITAARGTEMDVGIDDESADRLRMVGATTRQFAFGTYFAFGPSGGVAGCPEAQAFPGLWASLGWGAWFAYGFDQAMRQADGIERSGLVEVQ